MKLINIFTITALTFSLGFAFSCKKSADLLPGPSTNPPVIITKPVTILPMPPVITVLLLQFMWLEPMCMQQDGEPELLVAIRLQPIGRMELLLPLMIVLQLLPLHSLFLLKAMTFTYVVKNKVKRVFLWNSCSKILEEWHTSFSN